MPDLIYGLVDPRTLLVRYIGSSATGMRRPRAHRHPSILKQPNHKAAWLRGLLALGLDYTIVVLEDVASTDLLAGAERWWIAFGRACGWPLTNLTDGGEGAPGYKPTQEARARMSAAHVGKRQTPEAIAKVVAARTGVPRSPETRAKIAASRKGMRPSEEARAKIAAALRGRVLSPEARAKLAAAGKNNPRVRAASAKGAAALRGRARTPEERAKISAGQRAHQARLREST
jgi:hypothetical protein